MLQKIKIFQNIFQNLSEFFLKKNMVSQKYLVAQLSSTLILEINVS